jgi:hypothetical protein
MMRIRTLTAGRRNNRARPSFTPRSDFFPVLLGGLAIHIIVTNMALMQEMRILSD